MKPNHNAHPTRGHQIGGNHYTCLEVQPWDAMRSWLEPPAYAGFLRGNAIKCLARLGAKGPFPVAELEDARKARHYLDELILHLEAELAVSTPQPDWPERT